MIKKYFTLVLLSLLSMSAFALQYQGTMTLTLNGNPFDRVACTFDNDDNTVMLGNGYNACISHYEEGEITIPGNYTDEFHETWKVIVGPMAFRFCTGLTKVTIEEGVEHIGDCAFVGCSRLTHITLPSTLQTVGSGAFSELASLQIVKCLAETAPTWQWNDVFAALGTKKSMENMASKRILYIPSGSTDSYLNTKFDGTSTGTLTTANEKVGWQEAFSRIYELTTEPQTISTLAELEEFRDAVNNGQQYKGSLNNSVVLTDDIFMSKNWAPFNWTPIGTAAHPFDGVFDGGGHTIQGLNIDNINSPETEGVGLFGVAEHATIYNLFLYKTTVKGGVNVGTLLGYAKKDVRISDVLVTGSNDDDYTVYGGGLNCGGIVGKVDYKCSIERCMFRGVIKGTLLWCGGILGYGHDQVTISDCSASHNIHVTKNTENNHLGGIVGHVAQATIERCMARNMMETTNSFDVNYGYVIGGANSKIQEQRTISINNCAYWEYSSDISTIGAITENQYTILAQSGNRAFATEAAMTGDAAKAQLGDNWTYFTGNYTDYPIPTTLKDMYMHLVLWGDENGLVYTPVGTAASPSAFEVCGYEGHATELVIPDNLSNKPVTAILPEVFKGNSTLQTLTIGSNVKDIGESAFEDCDALTAVKLPDAVEYVHARAFRGCDNLTSFTIGTGFAHHDDNFIAECPKLSTLQMSDWNKNGYRCENNVLTHQSDYWFAYIIACAPGKTGDYTIPITYYQINKIEIFPDCFAGCTGLTSITFPAGMKYAVGKGAFRGATNLRYIDMHNIEGTVVRETERDTTYIADRHDPDSPFYGLSQSTIVYLPDGHTAADGEPNIVINGTANSLILTDGWDFNPLVDITATNGVTYNRLLEPTPVLTKSGYKFKRCGFTVCLPYGLTLTAENAKVYAPTAVESAGEGISVVFTEVTTKAMAANTPYYLVVEDDGDVNLSKSGSVSIAASALQSTALEGFAFKGSTTTISNAKLYDAELPAYILQSDGNWHKVAANTEDAYVPPFRAYLQANAANAADVLFTKYDEMLQLADDADNTDLLVRYDGSQVKSVKLDGRTLYKDGNWNTLCLPFDVTMGSGQMAGATAMTLDATTSNFNASTGVLTLNFNPVSPSGEQEGLIAAGTPFIVKWTGTDVSNPVFSDVTVSSTEAGNVVSTDGSIHFQGTYSPVVIYNDAHDNLYLGAANKLYWPSTEGYSLGACRAYFHVSGADAVRQFVLNFGDEETGIKATDYTDKAGAWYTLDGVRLSAQPTKKGLYIHGGKKVVIK